MSSTGLFDSDQYDFSSALGSGEAAALLRLRDALQTHIAPQLAGSWERGELPANALAVLAGLGMMNPAELNGTTPSMLFAGFRNFELARCDASIATFYNAVSGLFRTTIALGGSAEQVAEWDPLIQAFEMFGVFALTEPDHGSDIAGGLATTCERNGDRWTITGQKRWIGGADSATHLAVFARDVADSRVKGFVVPTSDDRVKLTRISGKTSLRIIQNFDIELDGVEVDETMRLQKIDSFADVAGLLGRMRSDVAWIACGAMAGAYEAALRYTKQREQFGRPIAGFQLVQEKLATMLANVTASLALTTGLTAQQENGVFRDEDSALAKMFTTVRLRETVALAREVVGGNGILLDYDVARFHADAEAIYSYEGTHEINALVVGRAATGLGAFR